MMAEDKSKRLQRFCSQIFRSYYTTHRKDGSRVEYVVETHADTFNKEAYAVILIVNGKCTYVYIEHSLKAARRTHDLLFNTYA